MVLSLNRILVALHSLPMSERNQTRDAPRVDHVDPIIGIDLGTTNSLVAWCDASGPRILPRKIPHGGPPSSPQTLDSQGDNQAASAILPSVVRFNPETGQPEAVGRDARAHAVQYPRQTVFSVKRLMGRGINDVRDELAYLPYEVVEGDHHTARVRIGKHVLSPQQVSAILLKELRTQAEAALGQKVRRAVITVPAYFDDAQRQATRDAGRIAGLEVLRIVNEPTAAALAYNMGQHHDDATVAVYDLGGGTFDVSILRLQHTDAGVVDQVLSTAGDTHLGGDDVDRMIVERVQSEIRSRFGDNITFPPHTRQALRNLAEAAKIRLSQDASTTIEVDLGDERSIKIMLTRDELETMMTPWVDRTIDCCRQALRSASLEASGIDRVILVGGSTRTPLVRRRVGEFFGAEPYTALDPDQVVALGAAVQGSILAGINRDMLLLDVIPLSLGIETMGGAVAKLIMANATIPARATEMFSTYADNQTGVKIHILQGERELVQDCRSLGRFELRGIPPMPAGLPKVEVTFLVDANGILNVTAIEKRSEKAASIQIVPNHGLTRQEVEQMEADSLDHALHDMAAHRLIDLRNQARMDMRAIKRQLVKVGDEIDEGYKQQVEQEVANVRSFVDTDQPDLDEFQQAIDRMDKTTVRLAELAISKTLQEDRA